MVKTGSINMAKAIRRVGHRSGQARKMTFYRTAIQSKDDYGVESTTVAAGNEGLTIPNIDAFIAPIVTQSDSFTRAGHTVVGSAIIYIPALSTIKKNVLGINTAGATTARLSSFNELESKDILYDMEKIIYSADSGTGPSYDKTYTIPSNTAGFEMDRLQFKVTDNDGTNRITAVAITDSAGKTLTWSFAITAGSFIIGHEYKIASTGTTDFTAIGAADSNVDTVFTCDTSSGTGTGTAHDTSYTNFDNAKYHTIDLPLSNVDTSDKAYCIYVPSSGASGIRTATATIGSSFNIKDVDGESRTLSTIVITSNDPGMTTKDFRIYKAGEWRINDIKEYRDEYMKLSCAKIRGERGSRRRAYTDG